MPRRSILSAAERDGLLTLPNAKDELIRLYTLNDADLAAVRQHRGPANRLGFAVQLCYVRHPGILLAADAEPFAPLLRMVAAQIKVPIDAWHRYCQRAETRREHLLELKSAFGLRTFATRDYRASVLSLNELAWQKDIGIELATALVDGLRRKRVLLPTATVIERVCAEAVTRANRRIRAALTESLTTQHRQRLDELPQRKESSMITRLNWLRQSAAKLNSRHMREHIDRLKAW